jgi:Cu-Zn family superoxide dismutase
MNEAELRLSAGRAPSDVLPFLETIMNSQTIIALGVVSASLVGACATTPKESPAAVALLAARSDSKVSGSASFSEIAGGVKISAQVRGLTPGEHGFHIHEAGDCSAADAMSAKGHFNPDSKTHGNRSQGEYHAGDMPNLVANAQGEASYSFELAGTMLRGPSAILGRSLVVHADPDDYKSQPAGNSGKRVACGVIVSR